MTAAAALDHAGVARISAIAARTASSHEGEAATALRMLHSHLDKAGLRLADVVERGLAAAPPRRTQPLAPHVDLAEQCIRSSATWSMSELAFLHRAITWPHPPPPAWEGWLTTMLARARAADRAHAAQGGAA